MQSNCFQKFSIVMSDPITGIPNLIMCLFLVEDLTVFMWLMTCVGVIPMELLS